MKKEPNYLTLEKALEIFATKQDLTDLEARIDAKFEIFSRRIIDDLSSVIRDVVDQMDRRFNEVEKERKIHSEQLARSGLRLHTIETRLTEVAEVLT